MLLKGQLHVQDRLTRPQYHGWELPGLLWLGSCPLMPRAPASIPGWEVKAPKPGEVLKNKQNQQCQRAASSPFPPTASETRCVSHFTAHIGSHQPHFKGSGPASLRPFWWGAWLGRNAGHNEQNRQQRATENSMDLLKYEGKVRHDITRRWDLK